MGSNFEKSDDCLWLRHLRDVGIEIRPNAAATFIVNGRPVEFIPMKPGKDGRPTHGLKAHGPTARHWAEIPKGTLIQLQLSRPTHPQTNRHPLEHKDPTPTNGAQAHSSAPAPLIPCQFGTEPRGQLPSTGSVIGIDVGYSTTRATTGIAIISWTEGQIFWDTKNARTDARDRTDHLNSLTRERPGPTATAIDGPLRPGLTVQTNKYRSAEAILSKGPLQQRGKPGQTNAGSGPALHKEATRLAHFAVGLLPLGPSRPECRIHDQMVVEAFPNIFLGSLCDEASYPKRQSRNWTDILFPFVKHKLSCLVTTLLPDRTINRPFEAFDHEAIAGLTCAVTALCMLAGTYTAVGSDSDGWIILPPAWAMGQGWNGTLKTCVCATRRSFPEARIIQRND